MIGNLPALPGEDGVAIDELPLEADAAHAVEVIEEVHAEGIAAIMAQSDLPVYHPPRGQFSGSDLPYRPLSGRRAVIRDQ